MAIKQDISGRKQVELTQRETERQLRAAQKLEAVGRLAGGVAHDFNNIVGVILSYTTLAVEDLRPEDPLRADLEEVEKAARRAAALTRQLLAFSRRQILETESIDLNEVIDGLARMLGRLIGEDIQLDLRREDGAATTRADRGQIEQVIMNLLINARDAMPDGGTITMSTRSVVMDAAAAAPLDVPAGAYVELRVADDGCGMDSATLARVFEPFFTTKEPGRGTGLGLAMVDGIVRQSGGGVGVDSTPGVGTTFRDLLPWDDGEADGVSRPSAASVKGASRGHESIVVVDDEEALRNVVARVLRAAGYRVVAAASGEEALALCLDGGSPVDLLLTDVIMGKMNGRELAAKVAVACPATKVLFMSGYADAALARHEVLDAELIRKPFDVRTLTKKVRQVLDGEGKA